MHKIYWIISKIHMFICITLNVDKYVLYDISFSFIYVDYNQIVLTCDFFRKAEE